MSNSDYKIKYVAPTKKFALAPNVESYIPIKLQSKKGLTEADTNVFVVNALRETELERNETTKYRIQGKLEIVTDNTLQDGWSFTPIPNSAWTPITEGTDGLDKTATPRNWLLNITYPFSSDDTKEVVTAGISDSNTGYFETKAYEGFQIKELAPINYKGGITNIVVRTSQKHGFITIDDFIYISPKNSTTQNGVPNNTYLGFHRVLDFEPGNEEYGLILDTEWVVPTFGALNFDFLGVGKRVFEPSSNDIVFFSPIEVTQVQVSNLSGGTNGDTIYTKIFSPEHSLRVNDFVEVRTDGFITPGGGVYGDTVLGMPNLYKVVATPSPDTFVIKYDFPLTVPNLQPFNFILSYKYLDGVPSEYYYRINKILTAPKDYEVYKAAFSRSIFTYNYIDDVFLFHFDKDVDVADLRDNLGRPLSQLYLTVTKRAGCGCSDNSPCDDGAGNLIPYDGFRNFSTNFQILDNNRSFTPINNQNQPVIIDVLSYWQNDNPNTAGTYKGGNATYYNDFVEYNRAFLNERILAETLGKTGPTQVLVNQSTPDGQPTIYSSNEGYTYKIHNEIRIRYFSTTIETALNKPNEIFPDYSQINNDGTVSWRDLLGIGFFEPTETGSIGVDYPYVNSKHYLFGEYPIYIRRQTPTQVVQSALNLSRFVKFNTNSTPNDEC